MLGESATTSCHFAVDDDAEYFSRSNNNQWISCKIIAVDKRSGKVQVSVKPGAWVRPDSEVRKVHLDEHPHGDGLGHHARFAKGDSAEYYSTAYGRWVPCEVDAVDAASGSIQISVKPGFWIDR